MTVKLQSYVDYAYVLDAQIHIQESLRLLDRCDSAEMRALTILLQHVQLRLSQMEQYDVALAISRDVSS